MDEIKVVYIEWTDSVVKKDKAYSMLSDKVKEWLKS